MSADETAGCEGDLVAALEVLVEGFSSTAHDALERIGRSRCVGCSAGDYDSVISAAQAARSGAVNDPQMPSPLACAGGRSRAHPDGLKLGTLSSLLSLTTFRSMGASPCATHQGP